MQERQQEPGCTKIPGGGVTGWGERPVEEAVGEQGQKKDLWNQQKLCN